MKRFLLSLVLLSVGILHAQQTVTEKKLKDIEKLLLIKPDSAHLLIRQVLNYNVRHHDTIYAMANTYNGYYFLVKNSLDSSVYYYEKALGYSANSPSHTARVLRLMAAPFRKKANYEKSLQLLMRAEKEYSELNNPTGLATVYGEIAFNYNAMLRAQDAIPYLIKAIGLLEKVNNKKDQLPLKQSLANTYLNIGNCEFAVDLYKETLLGFKEVGMYKNYYLTLINYSECLINLDKADVARALLIEAIAGLEQFGDKELIGSAFNTWGRLEIQVKNFGQGEAYAEKAFNILSSIHSVRTLPAANMYLLTLTYSDKIARAKEVIAIIENGHYLDKSNLQDLAAFEKAKIDVYKKADDNEKALASAKAAVKLLDSLGNIRDDKAVIKLQADIQHNYQSEKNNKLAATNLTLKKSLVTAEFNKWVWIYIPLLVLLLIIALHYYSNAAHSKKMADESIIISGLLSKRQSTRRLNERLKEKVRKKKDELSDIGLLTESIQENINKLINQKKSSEFNDSNDLDRIKNGLSQLVAQDDYRILSGGALSKANFAFEEKLLAHYPQLTSKDLYFCSLLLLNLPYKDLAVILNVLPEAVRKRKYRLRKKLGLSDEIEIEKVLAGIYNR